MATTSTPTLPSGHTPTQHLSAQGFRVYSRERVHKMEQAHTHPDVEFNYVEEGSFTYLFGGVRRTVTANHLTMFWAGIPHQTLRGSNPGRGVWGYIPLPWFLQWKLPNDFTSHLLTGELLEFPIDAPTARTWLMEHDSDAPEMHGLLELELRTAFTRFALSLPPKKKGKNALQTNLEGGELQVARITSFLAHNYANELSIEDIAKSVGLNRSYLMHLFRRQCGMSVWEYLTRLRISHAQRLLTTTSEKVLDIALECGFGSVAPFYAAFSRHAGCRPLEFRSKEHRSEG